MFLQLLSDLSVQTFLVFLLVLLTSWFILGEWLMAKRNLPPGPKGLVAAIIDNIRNGTGDNPAANISKMRERYKSDIFATTAGWQVAVALNTFDLIKEAFVKRDDIVDRPQSFILTALGGQKGVLGSNGQAWKEQRRFALSVLRDFGMGKIMIEEKIKEEASELLRELEQYNNKNIDLKLLITISVSNIICSIVFGQRYEYNDEEFRNCLNMVNFCVTKARLASLATDVFPFLQYLPGDFFHIKKITKNQATLMEYFQSKIDEHKDSLDPENIRSFIDAYLVEIEKRAKLDPDTTFTDDQLRVVISDLFIAGSETTASTLRFAILFMILNPEIQKNVQAEIDDVIGRERQPNSADRTKMPYMEAVLMEIQRAASIVPFGAPHGNTEKDIEFEGYNIPRQAVVVGNLYAVHHDETYWAHPNTFNPNNFLDEKGNVAYKERFIPFLIGRRSCPGESLAKMELFIFFTAMLQRFSFSIPEGNAPPSSAGILSITLQPKPHEVHISLRSD